MKISACVAAAAGAALVLSGCSNADSESDRPASVVVLEQYFEAIGSGDPTEMANAEDRTVIDSAAARYLAHEQNVAKTNGVNAEGREESDVEVDDDGDRAEVCGKDYCTTYTGFTFDQGKLASFSADGISIDGRIVTGDGEVMKSNDVAGYEVVSAVESDQALVAVMRLHAYKRDIIPVHQAVYRNADGEQVDAFSSTFPARIYADSNQLAVARFPHSELGGEIIIDFSTSDDDAPVMDTVRIPVTQD